MKIEEILVHACRWEESSDKKQELSCHSGLGLELRQPRLVLLGGAVGLLADECLVWSWAVSGRTADTFIKVHWDDLQEKKKEKVRVLRERRECVLEEMWKGWPLTKSSWEQNCLCTPECTVCCDCLVAMLCPTLAPPWAIAPQAPLSMRFPRQEYWSRLPGPSPGNLPNPGI